MSDRSAGVVVIGAGLMGASSSLALARRGHEVLTLEARTPGHRQGSSHGSTRIVRRTYLQPHYLELTGRAFELWRELEHLTGSRLLTMTGELEYGPGREPRRYVEALSTAGVPCELLTAAAAGERWPQVRLEGDVAYFPEAGVIDPELVIAESLRLARQLGVRVEYETPVLAVEETPGGVRLETAAGSVRADVVVVAAGPWLLPMLGDVVELPPLTVTQQQVFHFAPTATARAAGWPAPWPVVVYGAGGTNVYALPGGRDGLVEGNVKVAEHGPGPVTTADGRDGRIDPTGRRRVTDYVRVAWPGLDPEPVAERTCLYTLTPDEDFILDRSGSIVVCSPCSGHGAKFTPLIGEWVADLVERRPLPFAQFGLARFR